MAPTIRADYQLAELLVGLAQAYAIDDTPRPVLEKAAYTIKTDHEYGRVMSALRGRTTR